MEPSEMRAVKSVTHIPCHLRNVRSRAESRMRAGQLRRVLLLSALLVSCGPLGPLAGGRLHGDLASTPPGDWSFSDAQKTIQLEVRPTDPYSVNVWCVAMGASLYVGAGRGESSVWARALLEDPRARVRVGTLLYDVIATRITDVAEIQAYLVLLSKKYGTLGSQAQLSDFQPDSDSPASAILFRVDVSDGS